MKTKILSFVLLLVVTCLSADASGFAKDFFEFKGKVGSENVQGAIAISDSKTFGTFCYVKSGKNTSPLQDLKCTSCKSIGGGKYRISFKVELNGKNLGTWSITYNSSTRKATGTLKDDKGKTSKIDLYDYTRR